MASTSTNNQPLLPPPTSTTNKNIQPISSNLSTPFNQQTASVKDTHHSIQPNDTERVATSQVPSYACVLKKNNHLQTHESTLTKDQGIIITTGNDIKIEEYIEFMADLVEPENILFASRLSKDRIGMYLRTKKLVQTLTDTYNTIIIKDQELSLRPLITKAKRYIISSISPIISNNLLYNAIENLGLKITSPIQYMKVGCTNPQLQNILSYRRSFYATNEDNIIVPETILLTYQEEHYRIFISDESKKCGKCLKYGHITENCTISIESQHKISQNTSSESKNTETSVDIESQLSTNVTKRSNRTIKESNNEYESQNEAVREEQLESEMRIKLTTK